MSLAFLIKNLLEWDVVLKRGQHLTSLSPTAVFMSLWIPTTDVLPSYHRLTLQALYQEAAVTGYQCGAVVACDRVLPPTSCDRLRFR